MLTKRNRDAFEPPGRCRFNQRREWCAVVDPAWLKGNAFDATCQFKYFINDWLEGIKSCLQGDSEASSVATHILQHSDPWVVFREGVPQSRQQTAVHRTLSPFHCSVSALYYHKARKWVVSNMHPTAVVRKLYR